MISKTSHACPMQTSVTQKRLLSLYLVCEAWFTLLSPFSTIFGYPIERGIFWGGWGPPCPTYGCLYKYMRSTYSICEKFSKGLTRRYKLGDLSGKSHLWGGEGKRIPLSICSRVNTPPPPATLPKLETPPPPRYLSKWSSTSLQVLVTHI